MVIALLCSVGSVTALVDSSTGAQGADGVSDTIDPYYGPIGADSPLYGLKIAMEDLDETFTFNNSQRVEKQTDHGRVRIAEVQRELQRNRPDIAETALERYKQKLNLTERSLKPFPTNATGLSSCTGNDHLAPGSSCEASYFSTRTIRVLSGRTTTVVHLN